MPQTSAGAPMQANLLYDSSPPPRPPGLRHFPQPPPHMVRLCPEAPAVMWHSSSRCASRSPQAVETSLPDRLTGLDRWLRHSCDPPRMLPWQASLSMRPPAVSPMVRGAPPSQLNVSNDSPSAGGSTGSSSVTGPQVLSADTCSLQVQVLGCRSPVIGVHRSLGLPNGHGNCLTLGATKPADSR